MTLTNLPSTFDPIFQYSASELAVRIFNVLADHRANFRDFLVVLQRLQGDHLEVAAIDELRRPNR